MPTPAALLDEVALATELALQAAAIVTDLEGQLVTAQAALSAANRQLAHLKELQTDVATVDGFLATFGYVWTQNVGTQVWTGQPVGVSGGSAVVLYGGTGPAPQAQVKPAGVSLPALSAPAAPAALG